MPDIPAIPELKESIEVDRPEDKVAVAPQLVCIIII